MQPPHGWVSIPAIIAKALGKRHFVGIVHFVEFFRGNEWKVGANEGNEERPRLAGSISSFFSDPLAGRIRDAAIVSLVISLAGPDVL